MANAQSNSHVEVDSAFIKHHYYSIPFGKFKYKIISSSDQTYQIQNCNGVIFSYHKTNDGYYERGLDTCNKSDIAVINNENELTFSFDGNTYKIVSAANLTCELYKSNGHLVIYLPSEVEYNGKSLKVIGVASGAMNPSYEANEGVAYLVTTQECQYIYDQFYIYQDKYMSYLGIVVPSLESYLNMSYSTDSPKEIGIFDNDEVKWLTFGELSLPSTLNTFKCSHAFSCSFELKSVNWDVDPSVPYYNSTLRCRIPAHTFSNCVYLENVNIPSCILGSGVFYNCQSLSVVNISDSKLYQIGTLAFKYCCSLKKIDGFLENSIPSEAFSECESLEELSFSNTPISIYSRYSVGKDGTKYYLGAFKNCTSLSRINVPSIQSLLNFKYVDSSGEESFAIETAIFYNTIEGEIYVNGEKLTKVLFNYPTRINQGLFYNIKNLDVNLSNVTSIGAYAFYNCNLDEIYVPESVRSIGKQAISAKYVTFDHTTSSFIQPLAPDVEKLHIKDCESLLSLNGNTNIRDITIENLKCDIGNYEFSGCTSLESFNVLNDDLKSITIGEKAFYQTALKKIKIPSNVTNIARGAFLDSTIESVELSPLYELTLYCWAGEERGSFHNCKNLSSLTINHKGGSISFHRYDQCSVYPWAQSNINRIVFGDNTISANVDFYVTGYENYSTHIFGNYYNPTFSELEELEFGCNVSAIYLNGEYKMTYYSAQQSNCYTYYTKYGTSKINNITFKGITPPELVEGTFSDWSLINAIINVPNNALEEYKKHPVWGKFWNIQGYDTDESGVIEISNPQTINNNVYSIQGICIKLNATQEDINNLNSGLYIIGGKKILINK